MEFASRRSPVVSLHGCVSSSQPLASQIGSQILAAGGNAADAAVAVAAALNVTEPCSTGIGGDCFALYYDATTRKVTGINGSGRAPADLTLERVHSDGAVVEGGGDHLPYTHAHTVTVPGAACGWVDTIERHGSKRLTLAQVLEPAATLAENGVPIHEVAAHHWARGAAKLQAEDNVHGKDMLMSDGSAPAAGDIMRMPYLAETFRRLGREGKAGFYTGTVAEAIVECVQSHGGCMTLSDLADHSSRFDDPIHVNYKGTDVWEIPPNGQGITALIALNILEQLQTTRSADCCGGGGSGGGGGDGLRGLGHNSSQYLHLLIEAVRLAFADSLHHVACPEQNPAPVEALLSKAYAQERCQLIDPQRAVVDPVRGSPQNSSDTVQFCVVDGAGNACSFINSNYMGFGSGLVPGKCGFTLQNRGANFRLDPAHPNCLGPRKRPYHTIIPGMATSRDGDLFCAFGVMGGFMQPQGHVQVMLNMLEFGMNPQQALDVPRFCIGPGHEGASGGVALEEGMSEQVADELRALGHDIQVVGGHGRSLFGRGQIITRETRRARDGSTRHVLVAGSDPRADGCAVGLALPPKA